MLNYKYYYKPIPALEEKWKEGDWCNYAGYIATNDESLPDYNSLKTGIIFTFKYGKWKNNNEIIVDASEYELIDRETFISIIEALGFIPNVKINDIVSTFNKTGGSSYSTGKVIRLTKNELTFQSYNGNTRTVSIYDCTMAGGFDLGIYEGNGKMTIKLG